MNSPQPHLNEDDEIDPAEIEAAADETPTDVPPPELNPQTDGERPPFRNYRHAFRDLLENLANPRVGAQWREAKSAGPREMARAN